MWFAESSRTSRAPGISAASSRPSSTGTTRSSARMERPASGVVTLRRERQRRRCAPRASKSRTAVVGRGRAPQQLVVPGHLLRRAVREEQHAEHVAERGSAPSSRRGSPRPAPPPARSSPAQLPAARVAAVEDEVGDPLGMPRRVGHRDRRALRDAEQREALQARRVDDGLEVADPGVDGGSPTLAVRQPAAALVVADDGVALARAGRASGARPGSPSRARGGSARSPTRTSGGPRPCTA